MNQTYEQARITTVDMKFNGRVYVGYDNDNYYRSHGSGISTAIETLKKDAAEVILVSLTNYSYNMEKGDYDEINRQMKGVRRIAKALNYVLREADQNYVHNSNYQFELVKKGLI